MPWFKISDDWATHPKTIAAGKDARGLWVVTGSLMAKSSTDGLIAADQRQLYASLAGVPWKRNASKLIEVGFWHPADAVRRCRDCSIDLDNINGHRRDHELAPVRLGDDDLYWHAWAFHQLPKVRQLSPEAKASEDRARDLRKDTGLCQAIQKRDHSLCRFCGIRVDWRHRRGRHRATYEHLDPFCYTPNGGNYLEGVVTACGDCNSEKNNRTIDEWVADGGKTLKPAGWKAGDPDPTATYPGSNSGSNPDLIQTPPFSDSGPNPTRVHGRPHAGPGPGQVGLGPGLDPGRAGPGPGLGRIGQGPGLAGLVRDGTGAPQAPPESTTASEVQDLNDPATDPSPGPPSSPSTT